MTEFISINELARQRAENSISRVEEMGLPISGIPKMFFPETETGIRDTAVVTDRFIVLTLLSGKGGGLPKDETYDLLQHFEGLAELTSKEMAYLDNENPGPVENIYYQWQQESAAVLAWVNGWLDQLPAHSSPIDGNVPADILGLNETKEGLLTNSKQLPLSDVLDQADLYYRLYHAVRPIFHEQKADPPGLRYSVIYFRHIAFSWLTRWYQRDWENLDIEY